MDGDCMMKEYPASLYQEVIKYYDYDPTDLTDHLYECIISKGDSKKSPPPLDSDSQSQSIR
jgi:hypothetical protein